MTRARDRVTGRRLPKLTGPSAWPGGAPKGQRHDEGPRHLDGGHEPFRQAQGGAVLGLEDEPGQQDKEGDGHGDRAAEPQDHRLRRSAAGGEGRP